HATGGFHERLGTRCEIRPEPRRTRVLARQIYVFAMAGRFGFQGDWRRACREGVDYFMARAVKPDATVRLVIAADGSPVDDMFNLYDQAFALFAFAAAAPVVEDRARMEAAATALREALLTRYRHPASGFEEGDPPTAPLKANPHMHLFEACLAWVDAGGDLVWSSLADEIAELCLSHFIDPHSGFLREFFAADWTPAPGVDGRIVEPGHQFEWAWLMTRWGVRKDRPDALAAARKLAALGEAHGVDPVRGVAFNELFDDGGIKDGVARLWPQTERIKCHMALAAIASTDAEKAHHLDCAGDAGEALLRYFDVETPGLWRDRMELDGSFLVEPAPASTFYHIVCGIDEFDRGLRAL
ncbi:MAG TPA: AGE family epimerase/isomerase, partial [Methylomirabilota bacterium]|nr:AGE family epimerase/isomerase [Methylomirabilota bacterium]